MPPCHSCHGFVTSLQIPLDRRCTLPFSSSHPPSPSATSHTPCACVCVWSARSCPASFIPLHENANTRSRNSIYNIYYYIYYYIYIYIHPHVLVQGKLHCNRGCNRRAINQCPIHGAAKRSANFQVDPPRDKTVDQQHRPEGKLTSALTRFSFAGEASWKSEVQVSLTFSNVGVWESSGECYASICVTQFERNWRWKTKKRKLANRK